jgi:serine/threonine-protein kinase RsbW
MTEEPDVTIRFLEAHESEVLVELIKESYGDSYDAQWVYEPHTIAERIRNNTLRSTVGQLADGTILGHMALMVEESAERVVHAGVAVVRDAARGHHLFEKLKRFGSQWATEAGYLGIFSEATAAHPYSQKANIALGAHETGILLGWIPETVRNNAAVNPKEYRQSVVLFYLKLNSGELRNMYVPIKYQTVVQKILDASGLHAAIAETPTDVVLKNETLFRVEEKSDHNSAIIHVTEPGLDFSVAVERARVTLMTNEQRDAVYLDLPLDLPETEKVLNEQGDNLAFSFAGIFPNQLRHGDVLRLQAFNEVDLHSADIVTASDHGRELLEFILEDLSDRDCRRAVLVVPLGPGGCPEDN